MRQVELETIGSVHVFRAGKGEWYNQPHNKRWDMGEDVAEIPPAGWHVRLESALKSLDKNPSTILIDVTEMKDLVGQDWGFLLRLAAELEQVDSRLELVANDAICFVAGMLKIRERIPVFHSVDEATRSAGKLGHAPTLDGLEN